MEIKILHILTTIIMVFSAFFAVNIIRYAHSKLSWWLIAVAFLLMAVSHFINILAFPSEIKQDSSLLVTILDFLVSVFVLLAVIQIGRILKTLRKTEQQKAAVEKRFQVLFDNSSDEIFLADFDGNILEVNQEALNRLGYTKEELMKKNFRDIKTPKYIDMVQTNIEKIRKQKQHVYETEHIAKNGKIISLEMNSRVIDYFGKPAILTIARDITDRLNMEREIMNVILATEERERKRFAMDLHDGLAPILSTIKLYTDLIKKGNYKKISQEEAINSIEELVDKAIMATREISNNIMPNILLDFGLVAAIKDFCNYITNTNSVKITLDLDGYKLNKPGIEESIIYQSVKELINNTLKHSGADEISIMLESHDNQVNLYYKDNGQGFNVEEKLSERSGMGLNNIVNKIKTIKGLTMIKSEPGQGMKVLITLTIKEKENNNN